MAEKGCGTSPCWEPGSSPGVGALPETHQVTLDKFSGRGGWTISNLTPILHLLFGLITSPQVGEAGISCFQMMILLVRETETHQGHVG